MEVIGLMPVPIQFWRCLAVVLLITAADSGFASTAPVSVIRGGGGPETVAVHLGEGIKAVWNTRTGTLSDVVRIHSDDKTEQLLKGPEPPSWFVDAAGDRQLVSYLWKGYRVKGDQVVLLHELTLVDGTRLRVQEHPILKEDEAGLLSLVRTFTSSDSEVVRLIKRVRTSTPASITLPVRTNGMLRPLGLNDNWIAEVVLNKQGPTWITTVFNGQWASRPAEATAKEEKGS